MYGFGVPVRRLFTLALLQGLTCGVFAGGNQVVETFGTIQEVRVESDYFSPPWLEQFNTQTPGCKLGRGSYTWRRCGLGSNINSEYFGVKLVKAQNILNPAVPLDLRRKSTIDLMQ